MSQSQMVRVQPLYLGVFSAPVPVLIAGLAILGIRLSGVVLLYVTLGSSGISGFIIRAWQAWDSILLLLISVVLWLTELTCGLMAMRGHTASRWVYLGCQLLVTGYMLWSSLGGFHPELFSVSGESCGQIIRVLLGQKLPDLLILFLLFIPSASRCYFRQRL